MSILSFAMVVVVLLVELVVSIVAVAIVLVHLFNNSFSISQVEHF